MVGAKRFALPFARLAILAHDTGARHGDLDLAERARQRALAMAMPAAKPLGPKGRSGLGFLCRATRGGLFIGFRQSNRRGNAILDKAAQHPAQGDVERRVRLRPGSRRDASSENRLGGLHRSFSRHCCNIHDISIRANMGSIRLARSRDRSGCERSATAKVMNMNRLFYLGMLFACGLSSCSPEAPIAETEYSAKIVGDWQGTVGDIKETISFVITHPHFRRADLGRGC